MIYTELTNKAIRLAYQAHNGQVDKAGMPYILHPIHLAEQMDDEISTCVAILHDVVEDTVMASEEIREEFNAEVELLVDGVTKLGQLNYSADKVEVQAENLRKMFHIWNMYNIY